MIIQERKPNHICKFSGCTLGKNGTRKHYYACNDCDRVNSWKAIGCCFEHAMAYQDEVKAKRSTPLTIEDKKEIWKPDRVDDTLIQSETPQADVNAQLIEKIEINDITNENIVITDIVDENSIETVESVKKKKRKKDL